MDTQNINFCVPYIFLRLEYFGFIDKIEKDDMYRINSSYHEKALEG